MNLVQRTVRDLLKKYRTSDPYLLADYLGVHVLYVDNDELDEGFTAVYVPAERPVIVLNNKFEHSKERYFYMAHELYHAINHTDIVAFYHGGYNVKGKLEREANIFATYLCLVGVIARNGQSSIDVLRENYIPLEMEEYIYGKVFKPKSSKTL